MPDIILDKLSFKEDDQDYEANGGIPLIVSSFSNLLLSYSISLLLNRKQIVQINELILTQAKFVKEYREKRDIGLINGFELKYGNMVSTNVWLTSFSRSGSYYDIEKGIEKIRCKIDVIEAE